MKLYMKMIYYQIKLKVKNHFIGKIEEKKTEVKTPEQSEDKPSKKKKKRKWYYSS